MLAHFGGQPQPVRRLCRSKSLDPDLTVPPPLRPDKENQLSEALVWKPSPSSRPTQKKDADLEYDSSFTFCSTYQREFNGSKATDLKRSQGIKPVAGGTSKENNASRTSRCHSMNPRDSLANHTMDVVTAHKPADRKGIAVHGGYFGADGKWKACSSRKRNEGGYATAYTLNERELKEVMQPFENETAVREVNEGSYNKMRQGQRHRLAANKGDKLYLFSGPQSEPFKPAKKMPSRSTSVPPGKVGPDHRLLDYANDLSPGSASRGRRLLHQPGFESPEPREDATRRQLKATAPSQLRDHRDMLVWRSPGKLREDPRNLRAARELAAARRLEQRQSIEDLSRNVQHLQPSEQDGTLSDRAARTQGASQSLRVEATTPMASGMLPHEGTSDLLRGRRMGYIHSCQTDSDPIVGSRPLSTVEEAHLARRRGLRSEGFEHLSHHLDHDPIAMRTLYVDTTEQPAASSVRTRRWKSAM